MKLLSLASAILLTVVAAHADVRLPAIFSEHAVLQRTVKAPVWGWAAPGEKVSVSLDKASADAVAGADGKWRVNLDLSKAGDGPFALIVKGNNEIRVGDVVIGQVWVCAGQSNMEMKLSTTRATADMAASNNTLLRHFKVEKKASEQPVEDVVGQWSFALPATVGEFSGVGYYFGRMLQRELKTPVGLLNISWGGSMAEAWTSADALASDGEMKARAEELKAMPSPPGKAPALNKMPAYLFNGMIAPVLPYAIAGVIWYQGESNAGSGLAVFYRKLLGVMVSDWRAKWDCGEFPFYLCQLANYQAKRNQPGLASTWAELREAQAQFPRTVPNTGTAILIDAGELATIHPANKKDPGERLARLALAKTYGRGDLPFAGPELKSVATEGDKMRLTFTHAEGLAARPLPATIAPLSLKPEATVPLERFSPESELQGFLICGGDRKWTWANAKIDGESVIVWSPTVPHPIAVRYAWDNNPTCNLYNAAGLPAGPFRTDDFPLTVKPSKPVLAPDAQ